MQVALLVAAEDGDDDIVLRATRQPMIIWMWLGSLVMLVGAALSAFPGSRQRRPTDPVSAPIPAEAS